MLYVFLLKFAMSDLGLSWQVVMVINAGQQLLWLCSNYHSNTMVTLNQAILFQGHILLCHSSHLHVCCHFCFHVMSNHQHFSVIHFLQMLSCIHSFPLNEFSQCHCLIRHILCRLNHHNICCTNVCHHFHCHLSLDISSFLNVSLNTDQFLCWHHHHVCQLSVPQPKQ